MFSRNSSLAWCILVVFSAMASLAIAFQFFRITWYSQLDPVVIEGERISLNRQTSEKVVAIHDFGNKILEFSDFAKGLSFDVKFFLVNNTGRSVVIEPGGQSCGCYNSSSSTTRLEPGETCTFTVSIMPEYFRERKVEAGYSVLRFANGDSTRLELVVAAEIFPAVSFSPTIHNVDLLLNELGEATFHTKARAFSYTDNHRGEDGFVVTTDAESVTCNLGGFSYKMSSNVRMDTADVEISYKIDTADQIEGPRKIRGTMLYGEKAFPFSIIAKRMPTLEIVPPILFVNLQNQEYVDNGVHFSATSKRPFELKFDLNELPQAEIRKIDEEVRHEETYVKNFRLDIRRVEFDTLLDEINIAVSHVGSEQVEMFIPVHVFKNKILDGGIEQVGKER